ncbi:TetR/AcrR family transcriptional regulator [Bryocella elongata]|nr:TetR/AcrR family transcriptional regulator [Bryocella elongata]
MPKKEVSDKPEAFGRILDAATELFLEAGYESTGTSVIASRAKVSKRELYTHFGDKRAVLHAAITRLQEEIATEMRAEWSVEGDMSTVLLHAGATIHRHVSSRRFRQLFRIVAAESFHDPAMAKQFYKLGPGSGRIDTSRYLAKQMKANFLREEDPLRAADVFLDLIIGARTMTASALGISESAPAKKHIEQAVGLFLRCYAPEPAAKKRRGHA